MTPHPQSLFSHVEPDPVGVILNTGYFRFSTAFGVHGLAKWDSDRLDILAIDSDRHGAGRVRLFIEQAKKHFREVYFWHLMNAQFEAALSRYGFVPTEQVEHGEHMTGMKFPAAVKLNVDGRCDFTNTPVP